MLHLFDIDEVVDDAVGVAGDVREPRAHRWLFVEAMNRHEREQVVHGPNVGSRLEQREVAVIDCTHELFDGVELFGHVLQAAHRLANFLAAAPKQMLGARQIANPEVAKLEKAPGFLECLLRVVPRLLDVLRLDPLPGLVELVEDAMVIRRGLGRVLEVDVVHAQRVEDQHGLIRRDRPAAFTDDGGWLDASLFARFLNARDDVVSVLFEIVVHGAAEIGFRSVVVDGQAATDVEEAHLAAHLHQLDVDLSRFAHGVLHRDDARDLASDMEVQKFQAVEHVALLELFDDVHDLGHREAKLRAVAGGGRPAPHAFAAQLGSHSEARSNAEFLRSAKREIELLDPFEHDDDRIVETLRHQSRFEIREVLVAVADDEAVFILHGGECDQKLGLRAGLQPEPPGPPGFDDLLDEMPLLVDLDRKDTAVLAVVSVFANRAFEALVQQSNAIVEDVRETN